MKEESKEWQNESDNITEDAKKLHNEDVLQIVYKIVNVQERIAVVRNYLRDILLHKIKISQTINLWFKAFLEKLNP